MPWMDWVLAVALPDCCTGVQQRQSKPWKPALHQGWEDGSGLLAVGSPTTSARIMFLRRSQTRLAAQGEEQLLFNLLFAKCPHEPQKGGSFGWEVADIKSSQGECATLDCVLKTKNIKTKDFREPIAVLE